MLKRVVVCLGTVVLLPACSAMLDVEYDSIEHACAPSGVTCLTGYHCRDLGNYQYCVPDHAVPEFGECRDDLDCDSDQKCIDFRCMKPCTALAALTDCPPEHYCHPSRSHAKDGGIIGGCKPVDHCTTGSCGAGNTCIRLQNTPSITTCLPACRVTLSTTPGLDCTPASPIFRCQIAGLDKSAVCMESLGTPLCTSGTCNTVNKPCPNGQIVYNGSCRAWCDPDNGSNCALNTTCCDSVVNDSARNSGKLGLCLPDTMCPN